MSTQKNNGDSPEEQTGPSPSPDVVSPIPRHELALRLQKAESAAEFVSRLHALETVEEEQWAAKQRDLSAEREKALDAWRKELKEPSLQACRDVDDAFRPALEEERKVQAVIKRLQEQAALARVERQEALAAEVQAAAASGDHAAAEAALARLGDAVYIEGASEKQVWLFEVTDAGLVERHLCEPSEKLIQTELDRRVQIFGNPPPVPGIRFYKGVKVNRTGKRKAK